MTVTMETVLTAAKALVDAVSHDDNGSMVAGQWVDGNGGLLSRDTIKRVDHLRITLDSYRKAIAAQNLPDATAASPAEADDGGEK